MSEKTATFHNKAKEQRKPRSTHLHRDTNHHKSKDDKDELVLIDLKKEDIGSKTQPSDTKYGKKEIENNWNKYETKMETYEEFEKKKNMGANYEELSETPFSSGNHFQFKHEKMVYDNTSTEYHKHFQFDVGTLSAALLSLPFFERNSIDKSIFRAGEIENMIHRSTKFANKYKNMVKRNVEVFVKADANTKLADTPEPSHGPSKASGARMKMLPTENAVMDEVVEPETYKSTLLNNDAAHFCDFDVDQQAAIVEKFENIPVDTISTSEIVILDPPNHDKDENPAPKSTEDLEKWLDDFLDDS